MDSARQGPVKDWDGWFDYNRVEAEREVSGEKLTLLRLRGGYALC